jgi:GT2 family glycosyltransferase
MVHERFLQVCLIVHPEKTGFTRANNKAFQGSQSRYVQLLNPDTVIMPQQFSI